MPAMAVQQVTPLREYLGGDYPYPGTPPSTLTLFKGPGNQHSLKLARTVVWELQLGSSAVPESVARLAGSKTLVADSAGKKVIEYTGSSATWTFSSADATGLASVGGATRITTGASAGNTLICDPAGHQVLEVTPAKTVAWRFSAADEPSLDGPVSARRLANGNTLISDPKAGKVFEVRPDKSIAAAVTAVSDPRDASRLSDGTTLVVDRAGHRVVLVNASGTVTWQFGVSGTSGSDATHLDGPTSAQRLSDGSILIADAGNGRVLRIAADKTVLDVTDASGPGGAMTPGGGAQVTDAGTQLVADSANHRLLEIGYATSGVYESGPIVSSVNRWLTEIAPSASVPAGTSLRVEYRLNKGAWKSAGSGSAFKITVPSASGIQEFRFTLTSADKSLTPVLKGFSFAFFHEKPSKLYFPGKGGGSKGTTGTAGSGSGKGTGTTGPGTGGTSTTYGTGTGTGTGLRTGTGNGTGTGGTGLGTMTPIASGVTQAAADEMLSGFVMDERVSGKPGTGGGGGGGTSLADPAGLVAAVILLSAAYGVGYAAFANHLLAASRLARTVVVRSMHG